jgi:hypothetical protein
VAAVDSYIPQPRINAGDDASNAMEFFRRLLGKRGGATSALSRQSYPQSDQGDEAPAAPPASAGAPPFVPFNQRPAVQDSARPYVTPDQKLTGIVNGVRDAIGSFRSWDSRRPEHLAGEAAVRSLDKMGNIARATAASRPMMPDPRAAIPQAPQPQPSMIDNAAGMAPPDAPPPPAMGPGRMPAMPARPAPVLNSAASSAPPAGAARSGMTDAQKQLIDAINSAPDPHRQGQGDWRTALRQAGLNMIGVNGDFGEALGRGVRAGAEEYQRSKDRNKAEDETAYETRVKKANTAYGIEHDNIKEGQEDRKIGIEGDRVGVERSRVQAEADRNRVLDQDRRDSQAETARHNRASEGIASDESRRRDMIGRMMELEKTARGVGPDAEVAKSVLDRYKQPKVDPVSLAIFNKWLGLEGIGASPAQIARKRRELGLSGGAPTGAGAILGDDAFTGGEP